MSLDAEQLAIRRTGVAATDVPAILGLSPWRSPFDVWLEKAGRAEPVEETEDMQRGTFLEDGARRWYAHRTGAKVAQPGTVVHPRNPLVIATPDGLALHSGGDVKGLEIKMPSSGRDWGEPGTDAIPAYYLPQVAWQLAAMPDWTDTVDVFAVLEGKPRLYHVRRDEELEGLLVEQMEKWWRDHVVANKPPPVTHADLPAVSRTFRKSEGDAVPFSSLSPETQLTLEEYLRAYVEESAVSDRRATWEARAKVALGAVPCVSGLPEELGFNRLDWRQSKPTSTVDWAAMVKALDDEDPEVRRRVLALVGQHTKQVPGKRPFVPRPISKRGAR